MKTFFKSLLAATALAGVTLSGASAQDYTWTINLSWHGVETYSSTGFGQTGFEPSDAGIVSPSTFTLTRTGPNSFVMSDWNINTSSGTVANGASPTGFSNFYSPPTDQDSSAIASSPDAYFQSVEFVTMFADYQLSLTWFAGELTAAMNGNLSGTEIELMPGQSFETEYPVAEQGRRRLNGYCELIAVLNELCEGQRPAGFLTLTSISNIEAPPTATPEPASMALMGAGLLGLFAARRRRAA